MLNWLKSLWNKFVSIFKAFVEEAVDEVTKVVIAEFKDFAVEAVKEVASTDLSNEEKRKAVFASLKAKMIAEGKSVGDSVINLLIELAVSYVKKNG